MPSRIFPRNKLRLQPQFMRSQTHGFHRVGAAHTFHLKQHLAGTNHSDPVIRRAFALTHTSFGRLLSHRFVREQPQPDFPSAFDEAGHGHAAGFDLTIRNPARLHHFQTVISKGKLAPEPGFAPHATALMLAVLHFFHHSHNVNTLYSLTSCSLTSLYI